MRRIINYFRQAFCAHEYEYAEVPYRVSDDFGTRRDGIKVSATCTKCGYHRSYWKF